LETCRCNTHPGTVNEVVLYRGESAKNSHMALFSLPEHCYTASGDNIISSIISASDEDLSRLHISIGWEPMLQIAAWSPGIPSIHDVLLLIRKAGATDDELLPFRRSDIGDLFPWLYYGKRFDILRKICNIAKTRTESNTDRKHLLVYCHLVSDETGKIVASTL
jgi:hypothetical protein